MDATVVLVGWCLDEPERSDTLEVLVPDGRFTLEAVRSVTGLTGHDHAVNYARYLMREGAERTNEFSHLNQVMIAGEVFPASGRESTLAHEKYLVVRDWMTDHWPDVTNEVCLMNPMPGVADAQLSGTCWDQLRTVWQLLGRDIILDIVVTHFDQAWKGSPPHFHRSVLPDDWSFFEMVAAGVLTGRVALHPELTPEQVQHVLGWLRRTYSA